MDDRKFLKVAVDAARASNGTLEDRIIAFLAALPLPAPPNVGHYGYYNTQLLLQALASMVHDTDKSPYE